MVPFHLRLGTEKKTPYPESLYLSDIEPEHGHFLEGSGGLGGAEDANFSILYRSNQLTLLAISSFSSLLFALGIAMVQFLVESL